MSIYSREISLVFFYGGLYEFSLSDYLSISTKLCKLHIFTISVCGFHLWNIRYPLIFSEVFPAFSSCSILSQLIVQEFLLSGLLWNFHHGSSGLFLLEFHILCYQPRYLDFQLLWHSCYYLWNPNGLLILFDQNIFVSGYLFVLGDANISMYYHYGIIIIIIIVQFTNILIILMARCTYILD